MSEESVVHVLAKAARAAIHVIPGGSERIALREALDQYDAQKQNHEQFRLQEGMGRVERAQQDLLRVMMESAEATAHRSLMQRMDQCLQSIMEKNKEDRICSCRAGIPSGADSTCDLHGIR